MLDGGDIVSQLNQPTKFEDNVTYIKAANNTINSFIGNHCMEQFSRDKNNNWITCSKEQAYEDRNMVLSNGIVFALDTAKNRPETLLGAGGLSAVGVLSISKLYRNVSPFLSKVGNGIKDFTGNAFSKVGNGIKNLASNVLSFAKNDDGFIGNTYSTVSEGIETAENIYSKVTDAIPNPFVIENYASPEVCEHAREVSNNVSKFMSLDNNKDNTKTMDISPEPDVDPHEEIPFH